MGRPGRDDAGHRKHLGGGHLPNSDLHGSWDAMRAAFIPRHGHPGGFELLREVFLSETQRQTQPFEFKMLHVTYHYIRGQPIAPEVLVECLG